MTTVRASLRGLTRLRAEPAVIASGFTLIELMIVLVILAVILGVALPGFTDLRLTNRLKTYANEIVASVYLARSEAIKRNVPISLCASTDGTSCAGSGDWEQGWIVLAPDGTVIQSMPGLSAGFKVTSTGGDTLTFQPTGVANTPSDFKVCRQTPSVGRQERTISVIATGRPTVNTTTAGVCP